MTPNKNIVLGATFAALFLLAVPAGAQRNPATAVRQEVPDNPLHLPGPAQPIPYSHKTHLALGLQCRFCHVNPDPGRLMSFPAAEKCMGCHVSTAADKPAIKKLAAFAESGQASPWVRVYRLLSGPRWSHRTHLDAGLQCEMCHGQVSQLAVMAEVTSVTTMYSCLSCHQRYNAKTACNTCHVWP